MTNIFQPSGWNTRYTPLISVDVSVVPTHLHSTRIFGQGVSGDMTAYKTEEVLVLLLTLYVLLGIVFILMYNRRRVRAPSRGHVLKGMPPELLKYMNVSDFSPESVNLAASDGQRTCLVCLEDYESGDRIRTLFCGHQFHADCVDRWLEISSTCPMRCNIDLEAAARCAARGQPRIVSLTERRASGWARCLWFC